MNSKRILLVAALAVSACLSWAQTPIGAEQVLVKVNGQSITGKQYYPRMQVLPDFGKLVRDQFVPASPGFLTLQQLINEHLIVQLAKEQGVYPTDAEIAEELEKRKQDSPQLMQIFLSLGLSEDEFKWDSLVNLCQYRIVTRNINIGDMEVEQSYQANLATRYTLPRRFTIRVVSVTTEADQKKVTDALAAGKTFEDVASEFSQDEAKLSKGLLGEIAEEQLGGALKPEILKLKKGDMTGWVPVGKAWSKFWLQDVKEKQVLPLDDNLKRQIKRDLMIERGQAKNNMTKMMDDMRKKAQFEFAGTPFDEAIKKVFGGSGA